MSDLYDRLDATVSQAILGTDKKTPDEIRNLISLLNLAVTGGDVSPDERLARSIEARYAVSMGLGAIVDDGTLEPWLDEAKSNIDPFYWKRYKKLLVKEGLPQDVVTKLDQVTDQILSRLGNPNKDVPWDRRGMVVGHVQSGKTANYTGLICKAADAGYRLIIVIAGIHNNLRNQTQERIDEGFIGRDTGRMNSASHKARTIGVGEFEDDRVPVSLTTAFADFNKATANNNKSQIGSYNVPVVLVIKKNYRTLKNLIDWLKENSAKGDQEMIDQPMLLIDDEADNASINTKYSKEDVTKINGQIRDILKTFHRSCYVGYTATPFANIFIDPDQESEMYGEDLFPQHFIIGLDAPTNYFGGKRVFVDGNPEDGAPEFLRFINDNEDYLPMLHKMTQQIDELPPSLHEALCSFLLARTIRNLRGQASKHASMLVNASRFTVVQGLLRNRLHQALENIQDSLRVNGAIGQIGLADPEIAELHEVWRKEFSGLEFTWSEVQGALFGAAVSAKVVEVNSSNNGLDYSSPGQTVIAVGGYSLSRGLTLEGLSTTWFLRNTAMYDTLMQMGRWFGYRTGYEDLCRIWMPESAVAWYTHIAEATEELHIELRRMEKAKLSPKNFGLAVRSHPKALLVTARNKLGSGKKIVSVGLSSQFVETARLDASVRALAENRRNARRMVEALDAGGFLEEKSVGGTLVRGVPVAVIDEFLRDWINAEQAISTQITPLRSYIDNRSTDELGYWDVLIGSLNEGENRDNFGKREIIPMTRKILFEDLNKGFMSIGGSKMRVSSRGVERVGITEKDALAVEAAYRIAENKDETAIVNYPGKIYREVRPAPLFALYCVAIKDEGIGQKPANFPTSPVIAWAISLPQSSRPDEREEYIINTQRQREIYGADDEDDDVEIEE
jgi:Z1 domain